jgi:hypothetical protein
LKYQQQASKPKTMADNRFLANDDPVSLAVAEPHNDFSSLPFQLMDLQKPHTKMRRKWFENIAMKEAGKELWNNCCPEERVWYLGYVLHA